MDNSNKNTASNDMNLYTLDPPKINPPSAPVAEPVPITISTPVSYPTLHTANPYAPQAYHYTPTGIAAPAQVQMSFRQIRDWLPWSIISIFVGGLFPGIIPLIFSLACRDKKKKNDFAGAKKMSNFALTSNILVTLFGIILTIALVVYLVVWPNYYRTNVYSRNK